MEESKKYSVENIANSIGEYNRLSRELKNLNLDTKRLGNSEDYSKLLRLEKYFQELDIEGHRIPELANFWLDFVTGEQIIESPLYQNLKQDYNELKEIVENFLGKYEKISELEKALKPFIEISQRVEEIQSFREELKDFLEQ